MLFGSFLLRLIQLSYHSLLLPAGPPLPSVRRMPRRVKLVEDSNWREVVYANKYAMFIGYLSMAVKGLGFLVLTWTTVVLLGGFVPTLQKKDFWCLTFITLAQTAGVFDVFVSEKLKYIRDAFRGVLSVRYAVLRSDENPSLRKRHMLATGIAYVQQVIFVILLCPLAAVYMFGLLISAGISLWRLRQHDYGSDADGSGNLKPALDILYSLALLQGVIFSYKAINGFAKGSVVNTIIEQQGFADQARSPISDYLLETVIGCEKDPSFARGRNFITYAADLMGSKSPNDYLSGVRILDAFARRIDETVREWREENFVVTPAGWKMFTQEHILMKHLVMYATSSDILPKLLRTLGFRSIYDRETRERAARIVATIAEDIHLEEFPTGIVYISSLINTLEDYHRLQPYQRDWLCEAFQEDAYEVALDIVSTDKQEDNEVDLLNAYKELMVQGFRILRKLAIHVDNCRAMLDTPFLLHKIMAPLTSDLLHQIDHDTWYSIVEGSLKVIDQLTVARGQTGTKLRSEIASSNEAINTMERILECDKCDGKLQILVIWIFTFLHRDKSSMLETPSRDKFIRKLVDIITDKDIHKVDTSVDAANSLLALSSKIERGATIIMKANDNVVDNLTTLIVGNSGRKLVAAKILEYLCCYYTDDDESLKNLKKAMTYAVPKVFGEIVCWASEETPRIEVDQVSLMKPEIDVENQCGDLDDNGRGTNSPSHHQLPDFKMDEFEAKCFLSLCVTVCNTFISADQDLARQFDAIAPRDGAVSFPLMLMEIVKKNMHPRENCLEIVKLTSKMVISMMEHRGTYVKEELDSLMDALTSASKEMFLIDGSIVFYNRDNDEMASKPFKSLASLVKEAQELVDKHYALSS